jgi:DUF917 family protein
LRAAEIPSRCGRSPNAPCSAASARHSRWGAPSWPRSGEAVTEAICGATGGTILAEGKVVRNGLIYTKEAFDCGAIEFAAPGGNITAHVLNEYMALERDGERIGTYPDIITTLSSEGVPVSAGRLAEGMTVRILHVPKSRIALSASVFDPTVYPVVERALGIEIARFALEGKRA